VSEQMLNVQQPDKRVKNFAEVVLGLRKNKAIEAAKLFLEREQIILGQGCPLETEIFEFLRFVSKGDFFAAVLKIKESNVLPAITGRFSQEPYEETKIYNKEGGLISLRSLERFVADYCEGKLSPSEVASSKKKNVAVIGSGLLGLTAAAKLKSLGYGVSVFECLDQLGGSLRYAIPEFRLPKNILDSEIQFIESLGVKFIRNALVGQNISLDGLLSDGYSAVYLSEGLNVPKTLNIPGENAAGVLYAENFLKKINLMHAQEYPRYFTKLSLGKRVVVIGEGSEAVDCARICRRLNREVKIVLRSTEDDMLINPHFCGHAKAEGVLLETLANPVEIKVDKSGEVCGVLCQRLDYADEHNNDQWILKEVPDSDFEIEADTIIIASGSKINNKFFEFQEIKVNKEREVWTKKDSSLTSKDAVFVGGVDLDGGASVIDTMLSAKRVASQIDQYLT
jgi:glutamate synthase (NADPH/NADH) small chain